MTYFLKYLYIKVIIYNLVLYRFFLIYIIINTFLIGMASINAQMAVFYTFFFTFIFSDVALLTVILYIPVIKKGMLDSYGENFYKEMGFNNSLKSLFRVTVGAIAGYSAIQIDRVVTPIINGNVAMNLLNQSFDTGIPITNIETINILNRPPMLHNSSETILNVIGLQTIPAEVDSLNLLNEPTVIKYAHKDSFGKIYWLETPPN
jgi:hypothetical protein